MNVSSRTPEGTPHRCPLCGAVANLEPAWPGGDAVCPRCGQLVWWFRDRLQDDQRLEQLMERLSREADSLETVELVMELEEEFDLNIPDDVAETLQTPADVLRYLREQHRRDDEGT